VPTSLDGIKGTSVFGTNRTNGAGLMMSVVRGRPEVMAGSQSGAFDPERTFLDLYAKSGAL
jgi:hypothetical protein